jgi:hypothetical protein
LGTKVHDLKPRTSSITLGVRKSVGPFGMCELIANVLDDPQIAVEVFVDYLEGDLRGEMI